MLTIEEFASLDEGDLVITDSLLPALSKEPVNLRVRLHSKDTKSVFFVPTWHGVTLGVWAAQYSEDTVVWSFT